uniref:Uncharacterized protein n=1 Tax=Anguilla anguilla TaxID=7936 RepID=A0A0E9XGP0_ANGAN
MMCNEKHYSGNVSSSNQTLCPSLAFALHVFKIFIASTVAYWHKKNDS